MKNDIRYSVVSVLFENGAVTRFDDLFEYLPRSILSKRMGKNYQTFVRQLGDKGSFLLAELFQIEGLLGLPAQKLAKLVIAEVAQSGRFPPDNFGEKDRRYAGMATLIEKGVFREFEDIFYYLPKLLMAKDLELDYQTLKRRSNNPTFFSVADLLRISGLLGISWEVIFALMIGTEKPLSGRSKAFASS
jgi:hypothetical protein